MKALITEVKFQKEYDTKFGKNYSFKISYDGRSGYYSSKYKDQTKFVAGQEAEFTEETKTGSNGTYIVVKPPVKNGQSNFGKALNKEKSRYSGFAVSYAKDMAVAGRIQVTELADYAWILFDLMVEMDKTLES
jgi:hypothetical protein